MGRVAINHQCTPVLGCTASTPPYYQVGYLYDQLGDMTQYGNGTETLTQTFDNEGRRSTISSSLSDSQHPGTLAVVGQNFPSGAEEFVTLGNNLREVHLYNDRLQVCRYNLNTNATAPISYSTCSDSLQYSTLTGWLLGYNSPNHDNGNLYSATSSYGLVYNRSYTYDYLNRLTGMSDADTTAACQGLSWTYDAWGNRLTQTATKGTCGQWNQTFTGKNQMSTWTFDPAGNLTYDASGNHYYYDDENRIIQIGGTFAVPYTATSPYSCSASTTATACYLYDASGDRVEKNTPSSQRDYIYNLNDQVLAEKNTQGDVIDYIYFNDELVAQYESNTTNFTHTNHLGSTILTTTVTGGTNCAVDYLPFGEAGPCPVTSHLFTGKERDAETGNDDFGARYYASTMGRWISPDWSAKEEPIPYAKLDDPQTLNLYAYVRNNPLRNVDRDGHGCNSTNMDSGFCTRATEYGIIDANTAIRSQTRFFAAANAVSQELADSEIPLAGRIVVSQQTASFLDSVGTKLQSFNEGVTHLIGTGEFRGPNLDEQLVHSEQTIVQGQLDSLKQSSPSGYDKMISDINNALNPTGAKGFLSSLQDTDKAFAGVLDDVRKTLGRNIDFSKQGDRELIGNSLIKHIRQSGGCDLNGQKQSGCQKSPSSY